MKLLSQLKIGSKLEIELKTQRDINKNTAIKSQLVDKKNKMLYITNPIKQGIAYPLSIGQIINIVFYHKDKGVYSFPAEVVENIEDSIPIYIVTPIGEAEKIQRRSYYRLETLIKVSIKKMGKDHYKEGFTQDISGGGLKLIVKGDFKIHDKVECEIFLEKGKMVRVSGNVVRVEKDIAVREGKVSIEFDTLEKEIQKEIIAFIFKKQRELRQKGLI